MVVRQPCTSRTHQSTPFDFFSSKTPSSPVSFFQTGILSDKTGGSIPQGTSKRSAFSPLYRQHAMEWHTQVKDLFVKKSNQGVFLSYDTICDIVRIQFRALASACVRRRRSEFCEWTGIGNKPQSGGQQGEKWSGHRNVRKMRWGK